MKYFTRNWHSGDLPETEVDAIFQSYWQYIDAIAPKLPEHILELALRINLHDGLIRRIVLDDKRDMLHLELRYGDLQTGYFDLDLEYNPLSLLEEDKRILKEVVLDPKTEILYDEIDIVEASYIHRFLFWPYREVDIYFSQLLLKKRPAESHKIPMMPDRFVEINS